MQDDDDVEIIALEWALTDLAERSKVLADPAEVWERWWLWFVAAISVRPDYVHKLEQLMLEVTIRVRNELLAAV